MSDESIRAWACAQVEQEACLFERARRRFVRRPNRKRLHAVRTASRRLRSLLDDVADFTTLTKMKPLLAIIKASGKARDAAVLRKTVCASLHENELGALEPLLRELRKRERKATQNVWRKLRRFHLT